MVQEVQADIAQESDLSCPSYESTAVLQVEVGDNTFVYDVPHSMLNMNAVDQAMLMSETLRSYGFNVYTVVADWKWPST